MTKISIIPSSGTLSQSKNVAIKMEEIQNANGVRYKVENATSNSPILITNLPSDASRSDEKYIYLNKNITKTWCEIDLSIPEYNSDTLISIFVTIEELETEDNYVVKEILPLIYEILETTSDFKWSINISPAYVGPDDICKISVSYLYSKKLIFSVNDKRMVLLTNDDGEGSLHFRVKDIIDENTIDSVKRLSLYYYDDEDSYVSKKFSGFYINILPRDISSFADLDPRCDSSSTYYVAPGSWVIPSECIEPPDEEIIEPIDPFMPPQCLTTHCYGQTNYGPPVCRIFNYSSTMGRRGEVFNSYTGVNSTDDDVDSETYNLTRSSVYQSNSNIYQALVIANDDVNVGPKESGEDLYVYIKDDVLNKINNFISDYPDVTIYMSFKDSQIGYQCIEVKDTGIDEYTSENIIIGSSDDATSSIPAWLFCIPVTFIIFATSTTSELNFSHYKNYIYDENTLSYYPILSSSISSNIYNNSEHGYAYVVAEAIIDNHAQLFYQGISSDSSDYGTKGWIQITNKGNNRNPKIKVDRHNGIHIVWESDRSGSIQIYYGFIGNNRNVNGYASLSSMIDKYAEFVQSEKESSVYLDANLFTDLTSADPYTIIPEYTTSELVDGGWDIFTSNSGSVSESSGSSFLNDLIISANPINQAALSISSLPINYGDEDTSFGRSCQQYNFQIDFDMNNTITQTSSLMSGWDGYSLDDKAVDNLFYSWKLGFTSVVDSSSTNNPIYTKNGNKFVIGRTDNVFDRFVPFVGSYSLNNNTSVDGFKLKMMKDDTNLKDFVFGLLLEKSYFRASNIQTIDQFVDDGNNAGNYIDQEEHTIFTGKAKLICLIKTESSMDDRQNYFIFKEFPYKFDSLVSHKFSVICNYRNISSDEAVYMLNKYEGDYEDRYIGMITLFIDSEVKFSQSFISHFNSDYEFFDIGFGILDGGRYIADKMSPYKMTIYDDVQISMSFSNIEITSPYYGFNEDIVSVPLEMINMTSLNYNTCSTYDLSNMGVSNEDNILQIPVTFDGINRSPSLAVGDCGDAHISWEGNKSKYWNIYTSDTNNKFKPLRYITNITNGKNNSLMSSISVNRNGTRMIVWQDNREGRFEIYGARSLSGYECNDSFCKKKMYEPFSQFLTECIISLSFTSPSAAYYKFDFYFYKDTGLTDLYKIISTDDGLTGWYINGVNMGDIGSYNEDNEFLGISLAYDEEVVVSYTPNKNDMIFDKILYIKLIGRGS